jgi:hypothetical protein
MEQRGSCQAAIQSAAAAAVLAGNTMVEGKQA